MFGKIHWMKRLFAAGLLAVVYSAAAAAEQHKPFVLAYTSNDAMEAVVAEVKQKLGDGGFEVVGSYAPYDHAVIMGVTSDALKSECAKSEFGGYAAVQRVAVTQVDGSTQVAYTNPVYMAHAYRMAGDLKPIADELASALGREREYGPEEGMNAKELRKYHYMFGMEYFDDPSELAEYASYEEGVRKVEEQLAKGAAGVTKVYRVDIPGKEETVFGVAMKAPN